MAIRQIRELGDSVLTKECRPILEITKRIEELAQDMIETMYEYNGVGLAAPQVGILKQLTVIDVGEGPIILVNPEILESSGTQTGDEACLSYPGKVGTVTRPNVVKVRAYDLSMKPFEIEGTELLARALCHEIEHLHGHMYVEKVEGQIRDVKYDELDELDI